MNNHLVERDIKIELYPLKGEIIPFWIPLMFALIGAVNCILVTHFILNSKFNTEPLFPWSSSSNQKNIGKTEISTINKANNLVEEHAKQESIASETDIKQPIRLPFQDLNNEKEELLATKNGVAPAIINEKISAVITNPDKYITQTNSTYSTPAPDNIAAITKSKPIANEIEENTTLEQKPLSLPECPSDFFFTFPRSSVTLNDQGLLSEILLLTLWVKQHSDTKIFIEGHSDSVGPEEYNLLLSYRRAKAAEKILIDRGIPKNQLITRALGEQQPLRNLPHSSRQNRRVFIRIEDNTNCINSSINGDSN